MWKIKIMAKQCLETRLAEKWLAFLICLQNNKEKTNNRPCNHVESIDAVLRMQRNQIFLYDYLYYVWEYNN